MGHNGSKDAINLKHLIFNLFLFNQAANKCLSFDADRPSGVLQVWSHKGQSNIIIFFDFASNAGRFAQLRCLFRHVMYSETSVLLLLLLLLFFLKVAGCFCSTFDIPMMSHEVFFEYDYGNPGLLAKKARWFAAAVLANLCEFKDSDGVALTAGKVPRQFGSC